MPSTGEFNGFASGDLELLGGDANAVGILYFESQVFDGRCARTCRVVVRWGPASSEVEVPSIDEFYGIASGDGTRLW